MSGSTSTLSVDEQ
jgi:hypothetical protein